MIYTQQRRRAMNKEVKALYPDTVFRESDNGVPVMQCNKLPEGVRRLDEVADLIQAVDEHCVRHTPMGPATDYSKALPVFIRSMELYGSERREFYRVNYVSPTRTSKERAAEYISDGKLYAAI